MSNRYVNGSDVLLRIKDTGAQSGGYNALGHCTSHTVTYSSDTKDRAVKPIASADFASSLWRNKSVQGLSISIQGEGLRVYQDSETSFATLLNIWKNGLPVQCSCFLRSKDTAPYLWGQFVITNLEESNPAEDDATFSITLENDGVVYFTGSHDDQSVNITNADMSNPFSSGANQGIFDSDSNL